MKDSFIIEARLGLKNPLSHLTSWGVFNGRNKFLVSEATAAVGGRIVPCLVAYAREKLVEDPEE